MTAPFREVVPLPGYQRDLTKLVKRYRTRPDDIDNFIKVALVMFHTLNQLSYSIHRIQDLGFEHPPVDKARRIACRSLKGTGSNSGLRLIYSYVKDDDRVELVEVYYK